MSKSTGKPPFLLKLRVGSGCLLETPHKHSSIGIPIKLEQKTNQNLSERFNSGYHRVEQQEYFPDQLHAEQVDHIEHGGGYESED